MMARAPKLDESVPTEGEQELMIWHVHRIVLGRTEQEASVAMWSSCITSVGAHDRTANVKRTWNLYEAELRRALPRQASPTHAGIEIASKRELYFLFSGLPRDVLFVVAFPPRQGAARASSLELDSSYG